jgi:gliding-associated putative ABC transporter substrate-binding component GldG
MRKIYVSASLIILILLVVNLLSNEFHIRLDLTENRQYTLSKATLNILDELEEPVTIQAYFSEDLPPDIGKTRRDFQELLIEYANRSDGMVLFEFINPNEKEEYESEATRKGIQPVLINLREKDQVKQQKAYLGAQLSMGERQEVIPFVQPGAAMEYALSSAIKKIAITDKPVIGFLQGHGEPSLNELSQLALQLDVLYTSQQVTLTDSTDIPSAVKTLVVVAPRDSVSSGDLAKLDGFLARGGRMVLALDRVDGNFQNAFGTSVETGLEGWLQSKGIVIDPSFVIDAKCGQVTITQQQGPFTMQIPVAFPYIPIAGTFADHPATEGLETVIFEFASPIRFMGDTTKTYTPLVFTSDKSGSQPAPLYFDVQKQWTEADLPQSGLVMAAALEGKLTPGAESKMIVISDGGFAVSGPPQQQRPVQGDNVSLLSNAVDWLSDDTGLIELRTKGVTGRPIRELEDTTKTLLKYLNFLLPLLLVVGYGLVRFQQNRMTRLRRMSENYEED